MNWNSITLAKFQQIEEINSREIPDIDKVLFSVCVVFNMTEFELDNSKPAKVLKLTNRLTKVFESEFMPKAQTKIGRYFINYDVSKMTFGQYIELAFFLQNTVKNAHYIMATISKQWMRKHTANDHRKKANYFLLQPVTSIMGGVKLIKNSFEEFNKEYKGLFGLDKEVTGDVQSDDFNKRYGWIYSASQVAEYERITNDEAFALPVRQALNDLAYLKAKGKYDMEQLRKNKPVV